MARLRKGTSMLARRAGEVRRYRILKKVIPAAMACIAVLLVLVYVVSLMYSRYGSFTVSVNKYHQLQYGLSLSENAEFIKPTSHLDCKAAEDITNIDGKVLDAIDLGAVDGNDSGKNYLCYTFYCKNTGKETVDFEYTIDIANMTMDIEKAVRVRLITTRNTECTKVDYARAAGVDENNEVIPEPNTTPFYSKNAVLVQPVKDFLRDEVIKYTVVIWLEGPDPDCVDKIVGGEFKIDMKFTVVSVAGEDI